MGLKDDVRTSWHGAGVWYLILGFKISHHEVSIIEISIGQLDHLLRT